MEQAADNSIKHLESNNENGRASHRTQKESIDRILEEWLNSLDNVLLWL